MRKAMGCLATLVAFSTVSAAEFPTGPIDQFGTTNDITISVRKDPWEPNKRFNYVDPKTGLRTGGFIKKDTWEGGKRWNRYGETGKYEGKWEKDDWNKDRWNYTPAPGYDDGVGVYDDGIGEYSDGTE